jgi:archaemetzincin
MRRNNGSREDKSWLRGYIFHKKELILNSIMKWCLLLISFFFLSCLNKENSHHVFNKQSVSKIYLQPFDDIPSSYPSYLDSNLKKFCSNVIILSPVPLPKQAWYEPRKRYRADTLINWLQNRVNNNEVVIGLTSKDISTTKNQIIDYGIMGLGLNPGKSCVVSTFRLNKQNLRQQLFKVTIHELEHTQGLNHCPVKTCFMRDAEGGNPTDEEKEFCENCRQFLITKGWTL